MEWGHCVLGEESVFHSRYKRNLLEMFFALIFISFLSRKVTQSH